MTCPKVGMAFPASILPHPFNIFKARLVFITVALTDLLQGACHDPGNGG